MTEEQLKKIEAFKATDKYRGWSTREQNTFVALWKTYMALRSNVGPFTYITRQMLLKAHGTHHMGTVSKFMTVIEEQENDQPPRGRRAEAQQSGSTEAASPAIQTAFDGVAKALEAALNVVLECRTQEVQELSTQYQRLQREYLVAADAREQALSERIADLEKTSAGAGEESWNDAAAVEELRLALEAVTSERDAEKNRADQATTAYQLALAQLATAEAHVQASAVRAAAQATEIGRLTQERDDLVEVATRSAELGLENAALRERADQAARLETIIAQMDVRHAQERETMRAAHEAALAEERQRRLGWLGVPLSSQEERG